MQQRKEIIKIRAGWKGEGIKPKNKQTKKPYLRDRDNSMIIIRGKEGGERVERERGDEWGWKETGLGVVNTQSTDEVS